MTLALIDKGFVLEVCWPSKYRGQLSSQVYIPAQFLFISSSQLTHFERPNPHKKTPLPPLKHAGAPWPHGEPRSTWALVGDGLAGCNLGRRWLIQNDDFPPGLKNWVTAILVKHVNLPGCTPLQPNMTMENPPFEDVFPINKHGDFPMSCQFSRGVTKKLFFWGDPLPKINDSRATSPWHHYQNLSPPKLGKTKLEKKNFPWQLHSAQCNSHPKGLGE